MLLISFDVRQNNWAFQGPQRPKLTYPTEQTFLEHAWKELKDNH